MGSFNSIGKYGSKKIGNKCWKFGKTSYKNYRLLLQSIYHHYDMDDHVGNFMNKIWLLSMANLAWYVSE